MRLRHLAIILLAMSLSPWLRGQDASDSLITAEEYIAKYRYYAIQEMLLYNIPASITMAQGLLETGNGNSRLAREANNHFGIKCHKGWEGGRIYHDDDEEGECFRVYDDPASSYRDHSIFLTTRDRYAALFDLEMSDYEGWAKGLKAAGYATNPKYPELLITRIEQYGLMYLDTFRTLPDFEPGMPPLAGNLDKPGDGGQGADPGETVLYPSGTYEVMLFNRIKYIEARTGDTPRILAEALDMMPWQITRYNDIDEKYVFRTGERVYLQPKRNKGTEASHTLRQGESLRDVSQEYGVKMRRLLRYNGLEPGQLPAPGTEIHLRRPRR